MVYNTGAAQVVQELRRTLMPGGDTLPLCGDQSSVADSELSIDSSMTSIDFSRAVNGTAQDIEMRMNTANAALERAKIRLQDLMKAIGQNATPVIDEICAEPETFLAQNPNDPPTKTDIARAMIQVNALKHEYAEHQERTREERERKERREARRDEEERIFRTLMRDAKDYVQLNVGGETFTTSKSTLLAGDEGSIFDILFSGRHGEPDHEPVFLDRDPRLFPYILEYLRFRKENDGRIPNLLHSLRADGVSDESLRQEFAFYRLTHSWKFFKNKISACT